MSVTDGPRSPLLTSFALIKALSNTRLRDSWTSPAATTPLRCSRKQHSREHMLAGAAQESVHSCWTRCCCTALGLWRCECLCAYLAERRKGSCKFRARHGVLDCCRVRMRTLRPACLCDIADFTSPATLPTSPVTSGSIEAPKCKEAGPWTSRTQMSWAGARASGCTASLPLFLRYI